MLNFAFNTLMNKIKKERKPYGHKLPYWVADFLNNYDEIKKERQTFLKNNPNYIKPIDEISEEQKELNEDKKWKALFIYGYGYYNDKIKADFPLITQLIEKNRKAISLVMFSTMESGKEIPPHTGNNFGVLRIQIGIDIHNPDLCGLKVEDKVFQIKEGEIMVFDDTFTHSAWNNGETNRTVLIIDFLKPLRFPYSMFNKMHLKSIQNSPYIRNVLNKL
ncbi:MAG: aspartyl/asparaginyl beta-hydroxylase domain-containing protein [Chitinophagales bacterium]|nr:aspartyl/asparaginyl beta-hydroxylase domain-containing protein [Chitinophagales bacterium]